jgi:hypothetical protein
MIVKINRRTARTCFKISTSGCDRETLRKDNVDIVLSRCGRGRLICDVQPVDVGCGSTMPTKRLFRVGMPRIRYCAFSADPDGSICFLWDDKFLNAEPGIWIGEVRLCEKPIAVITFHLGETFQVLSANSVPVDACAPCGQ